MVNLLIENTQVEGNPPAIRALAKIHDAVVDFDGLTYHILEGGDGSFSFGCMEGNESLTVNVGADGSLTQHWHTAPRAPNDTYTERTRLGKFQKAVTTIIDNHDITLMQ